METISLPPSRNGQNGASPTVSVAPVATAVRDDFSFKDLLDLLGRGALIVRSRWYWGLFGALLVGVPIGYVLYKRPMEYTAQTALLAQSALDKVIGTQADGGDDLTRENNLRNHLSMMNSRRFRARLLASLTPEEKAEIAAPYLHPGEHADDEFFQTFLPRKVNIERERGREYYTIAVTHMVPKTAMMIADHMATQYLAYVQQEYKIANVQGYQILQKQADMLRADIAKVESERLDFRKRNGIISRTENQGILAERLKRLDSSLTETRIKRVGLETLSQQATADRARSEYPWDNAYLAGFANNATLRQELDRQFALRGMLASRYGPNHPKLRDVDSQIKGIQAAIQRNFDVAVRDLAAQLEVVIQSERLLKKEFDAAFESSIEIEKLASNYEILSAGVESKKITLNELEKKIGEASIFSKLPADFMQIVDPAYMVKPRVPRIVVYAGFVLLLSLGAFVLTPLLVSAMDERISANHDIEQDLRLPMLAAIPKLRFRAENRAHVVRDRIDAVATESFMGIAGHLEIDSANRFPKVILVTSTLPEEGKSLVASNLASTYQLLEKRCVLVDLDLRRPSQHVLHGIPLTGGFLPWAKSGYPMDMTVTDSGPLSIHKLPDGADLIVAGGAEPQPGHLLVGKPMERFIEWLKANYDVVIIDTPPAGVFQDAMVLARHASASLLVAREGVPPLVQVRKVIDDFARANVALRGVVLNGFAPRNANKKLAYAYKAASQGYSYYRYTEKSGRAKARANGTSNTTLLRR
jgi:capsular exopolysaccharide synthesis family protein